jgi:thioester reductase-like protein
VILLTGATGTLGGWLLVELLRRTDAKVVCLVRGDPARARERLFGGVEGRTGQDLACWDDRIDIVHGDVSRRHFGLVRPAWDELARRVDSIYHAAARVHLVLPYRALRADNVVAAGEVLRLVAAGRAKRLHHVSTLSVFVATDQNSGRLLEDDTLDATRWAHGGYAQSKWAAEWLLRAAAGRAGPVMHYRPGLITPDTRTGRGGAGDFLTLFVRGLARLGCLPPVPAEGLWLDVTPVNYAAAALVHLSLYAAEDGATFHLANRRGVSLAMIRDALAAEGVAVPEVAADEWRERVAGLERQAPEAAAACLAICRGLPGEFARYRTMDLFQATDVVFDTTHTDAGLAGTGIRCPAADMDLLRRYVRAALDGAGEKA